VTIFWNDFEILQLIDACEQGERGGASSGIDLALTLTRERGVGLVDGDDARLVRELLALRDAGLLTWQVLSDFGRTPIVPHNANDYLNNIREFALTIAGRDRARGQIIYVPTPDQDEDDGRRIRSMTLENIAGIVGEAYSAIEVLQFLADSGVSLEGFSFGDVVGGAPGFAKHALYEMATGTSGHRRELRHFIGAWLDDRLDTSPSDAERDSIERDLARQGWFVKDGRLVIGEPVRRGRGTQAPTPAVDQLHPIVWKAAETRWKAKHLHDAVMAASKVVNAMLQAKLARDDLSEVKLVQAAFSMDPPGLREPRLRFPDVKGEQTRTAVTVGAMNFGVGCFMATRDPLGHLPDDAHQLTEQEAREQLAAWSLLARWIDRATLLQTGD
jgi:hypothetical protein